MNDKIVFAALGFLVFFGGLWFVSKDSIGKPYEDAFSPVMYFYSDTCSHCQAMKPILSNLAAKGFRLKPMDVRANPSYWQTYSVQGTPTWVASNGDRLVGEQGESYLEFWLESHGAKIK